MAESNPQNTLLRKMPPSLPPEDLPDESISTTASGGVRGWFKSQGRFWKIAWQEFQHSKEYRWMKATGKVGTVALFTVFGLGVYQIVSWLFPLLPKLAWLSITLGIVIIVQELAIHFLGRFHESTERRLKAQHSTRMQVDNEERSRLIASYTEQIDELTETQRKELDQLTKTYTFNLHETRKVMALEYERRTQPLIAERNSLSSQLEERTAELELYKNPQVDIVYKREPPYWVEHKHSQLERRVEVYINVTSRVAINDLRVEIEVERLQHGIERQEIAQLSVALRKADGEVSKNGVFAIEANGQKLFHLASWVEPDKEFTLHTTEPVSKEEARQFNIIVRGSNTLPLKELGHFNFPGPTRGAFGFRLGYSP